MRSTTACPLVKPDVRYPLSRYYEPVRLPHGAAPGLCIPLVLLLR
jgi:hypothetical protein